MSRRLLLLLATLPAFFAVSRPNVPLPRFAICCFRHDTQAYFALLVQIMSSISFFFFFSVAEELVEGDGFNVSSDEDEKVGGLSLRVVLIHCSFAYVCCARHSIIKCAFHPGDLPKSLA